MSVHDALRFIGEVRKSEALKEELRPLLGGADLEQVCRIGVEAGFVFTTDELRAAYKHDWAMRWLRDRIREGASSDR